MSQKTTYTILPCNGLDKTAGCVAREVALDLAEKNGSEIICPVLYRVADARYNRLAQEHPVLVIDGCATRCASKLAAEKGLQVARKLNVAEEGKKAGIELGKSLRLDAVALNLTKSLVSGLAQADVVGVDADGEHTAFPEAFEYETYRKDKFIFRLPKAGFYFNENDFWVYVLGNRARVGVTDFLQQSLSDVTFYTAPALGAQVEQFGELGAIETSKAALDVVSPVTGRVVAVNQAAVNTPDLINDHPYDKGWLVELELADFDKDRELLLDFAGYLPIMKRKVDDFEVK